MIPLGRTWACDSLVRSCRCRLPTLATGMEWSAREKLAVEMRVVFVVVIVIAVVRVLVVNFIFYLFFFLNIYMYCFFCDAVACRHFLWRVLISTTSS